MNGINNFGVTTDYYIDSSGNSHGLIDIAGRFIIVNNPNAGSGAQQGTYLYGLNDLDVITGQYFDASIICHGFIYIAGSFVPINVPGSVPSPYTGLGFGPTDINDAGVVVGGYYTSNGTQLVENGFSLTPSH